MASRRMEIKFRFFYGQNQVGASDGLISVLRLFACCFFSLSNRRLNGNGHGEMLQQSNNQRSLQPVAFATYFPFKIILD